MALFPQERGLDSALAVLKLLTPQRQISSPGVEDVRLNRVTIFPSFHASYKVDKRLQFGASYSKRIDRVPLEYLRPFGTVEEALLQRLAAVRGRLSLCADQAAAAKWWLSMPMASVSAEGPMPKALSTRRTSPLMPGCRHQGRACPLRRARMTSNPLIVA